jgi:hypothetical protein
VYRSALIGLIVQKNYRCARGFRHISQLSPCSRGHCQSADVFAAYAKAGKTFFFAHDVAGSVKYFPDRARWPADLTQIVDEWVGGAMRN